MKSSSFKGPPKKKVYRSYKNFSIDTFNDTLKINLDNIKDNNTYGVFEKTFLKILDKQAPLKTKILRYNNNSFMSKELRKNIMLWSKLKNSFNKDRSYKNWCKYKRQRNFYVNLLRITKGNFFKNVNEKKISDNRTFWREIKPYFNGKGGMPSKITLVKKGKIIHKNKEIAKAMNKYFVNVTKTLRLKRSKAYYTNDIDILTSQFKDHTSIKKIKLSYPETVPDTFNFTLVSSEDVKKEIMNLNVKKSSSSKAMPVTILKQSVQIYLPFLTNCINHSFVVNKFPDELKHSEVIPLLDSFKEREL